MKNKRKKLGRKLLSFLLALAMVIGLMPGMGLTAKADGTTYDPASAYTGYDTLNTNNTTVTIDGVTGYNWYVIGYSSADKTVTLFSKQSFGKKAFNSNDNKGNNYANSDIKTFVEGLTGDGKPLAGIKDALADINGKLTGTPSLSGAVPYLLSKEEAQTLNNTKRGKSDTWWLRSPDFDDPLCAAYVQYGTIKNTGVSYTCGVRPALKLDLSKMTFDSASNEFSLKSVHTHDDITFTAWTATNSMPPEAGNYYLANDVTLGSTWNVPTGITNLCLNGHAIKSTGDHRMMEVGAGVTLSLYDEGAGVHKYTLNGNGLAVVDDNATGENVKTFEGGYLTGAYASNKTGACVLVKDGGIFNMHGGTMIGNYAAEYAFGGAVSVQASRFEMTG